MWYKVKSIVSGSIGNLIEWYDWYVYAAFSIYFSQIFFPEGDLTSQLLKTSGIFAVGFFMRPIGGWIMGAYADIKGRKKALILSINIMCIGSLIIALTPSYDSIGVLAPLLLLVARLMQGLSVGGEYGISATYLSEVAPKKFRGFYSSFQYVTLIMGQLIALLVLIVLQNTLSSEQLYTWGWRIPFFIGALCAIAAMIMRMKMEETNKFSPPSKHKESALSKLRELLKHKKTFLLVIGLSMGGNVAFYTYTTYMLKYLINTIGMPVTTATWISSIALLIFMCLQPVIGLLSDYIGRKKLLITFGLFGTLGTVPILTLLEQATTVFYAFTLIMLALVVVSLYTSINAIVKAELFPVEVRAIGVALPYSISVAIFGGTAEYIALYFKDIGIESGFYWYVTFCIFCSLMTYIFMPDTMKRSKI
ncbi:MFS transporter [uncultured Shewanella sp.]|uniref:MFS transporter n=1 Tax=uncultured Shewanella sp. TaxID=173975 RepID=UPI00260713E8|nr:MFS transporter [uncultured Shewanella sp.]